MKDDEAIEIKMQFGKHMRKLREERGHSQEELADLCDLDRTYIGGIERGERNISLVNIIRVSAGLDINPAELFESFALKGNRDA